VAAVREGDLGDVGPQLGRDVGHQGSDDSRLAAPKPADRTGAGYLGRSEVPIEAQPKELDEGTPAPSAVADVPQLGLIAALASLSYVFWVVGGMEMIERLAYYGVKAVATLYAKQPASTGGLGVSLDSFGNILATWALVQCVVPVFTGGLSDRYGYKQTIAASTVIKIAGYLTMAAFPTYWGFFAGAIVLATGTAVFKPGIQGTLVKATRRDNSSMAWGVFYQTVNIGGFLGPLVAGYMRKMEWRYVFLACAAIISVNFLLLLAYREPGIEDRLARARESTGPKESLWRQSVAELVKPHVWPYLLVFSGFWFMFNSLFDVLPAHIEDWVDTRDVVTTLFGADAHPGAVVSFFVVMNQDRTEILPEGMLNVNSMLIVFTCFLFAALSGRMKAITSMVIGTLLASVALFLSGLSSLGWISLLAISVFSVGEMLSSPKFSEYIGNFAPTDKKAMYLGFSQIPLAIGWTLEGKIGPRLYDALASKDTFSRQMLVERGMAPDAAAAIPQGEAFQRLVDLLKMPPHDVTALLLQQHHPGVVWLLMGSIGVLSAAGIWAYGRWVGRVAR
jgi:MFS family permease